MRDRAVREIREWVIGGKEMTRWKSEKGRKNVREGEMEHMEGDLNKQKL